MARTHIYVGVPLEENVHFPASSSSTSNSSTSIEISESVAAGRSFGLLPFVVGLTIGTFTCAFSQVWMEVSLFMLEQWQWTPEYMRQSFLLAVFEATICAVMIGRVFDMILSEYANGVLPENEVRDARDIGRLGGFVGICGGLAVWAARLHRAPADDHGRSLNVVTLILVMIVDVILVTALTILALRTQKQDYSSAVNHTKTVDAHAYVRLV